MTAKPKLLNFPTASHIFADDPNIVAEVMNVTPTDASEWLKCNRLNRPVRKSHVRFLAEEMKNKNWQVNGQAIVIADDEQVLDGQHRLFAIIESGCTVQTLVVYGITPEAFRTMDTGIVRTGGDALVMHYPEIPRHIVQAAAVATKWCMRIDQGYTHSKKISNTDVIEYVKEHPSIFSCAETLQGYPHEARPLTLGNGTALYELFARKHEAQATSFMQRLFTGEELKRTDVEYLLRVAFIRDADRVRKYPMSVRMRMAIKGWNWKRRGNETASVQAITLSASEDPKIRIF